MERETDRQICAGSAAMWVSYRSVVVTKESESVTFLFCGNELGVVLKE